MQIVKNNMNDGFAVNKIVINKSNTGEHLNFNSTGEQPYFNNPFLMSKKLIDIFVNLEENWDGYGGIPLYPDVAENAKNVIRCLDADYIEKITDIFPNPHGTVTIEWENSDHGKFSLEIGKTTFSYFINMNDGHPQGLNGNGFPEIKLIESNLFEVFRNDNPRYFFVQ